MITLGIESTCDETAISLVKGGEILCSLVASQIEEQKAFGGVVPELAARRHLEIMIPLLEKALEETSLSLHEIDLIAVSYGPGLIGPLLIGLNTAKTLSLLLNKPFIGVNHVEAHLYACSMSHKEEISFPTLGMILSGGHSHLLKIEKWGSYKVLSHTIDDAIGEAFDKVARILGLPYPGGPPIEALAKKGDPKRFLFSRSKVKENPLYFSFSGLKTAVLYAKEALLKEKGVLTEEDKADLAASFQATAFKDVIEKSLLAAKEQGSSSLVIGGGVTASQTLRTLFQARLDTEKELSSFKLYFPTLALSQDNAAMIAGLGAYLFENKGISHPLSLSAKTRIPLGETS